MRDPSRKPALPEPTVPAEAYDERYYLSSCAGHPEWVESGGAEVAGRYEGSLDLTGLRPGEVLLDVGAGRGELLAVAAKRGASRAIGVEYAPAAVELARRTLAAHGVTDRAEVIEADSRAMPLEDELADVATLLDVVEHLSPDELHRTLREVHRVLKPGGRLLLHTMPNRSIYAITYRLQRALRPDRRRRWPADPRKQVERLMHVNEQSVRSLRRALRRAGFRSASVRPGAGIYTDFVPDARARRLYRALAPLPLAARLGAADIWAQATRGAPASGVRLPPLPRRPWRRPRAARRAASRARSLGRRLAATGRPSPDGASAVPERPLLLVQGHSVALGAGASDQQRTRFTRLLADRLGLIERNRAVGGAIAHWSTHEDVGDGGYPSVLQDSVGGRRPPPGSATLLLYGINDLAILGDRLRPYQEALRTIVSRCRAESVFEAESGAGTSLSPEWAIVTGVSDRNSGTGYARAEKAGASAAIELPAGFGGATVVLGFVAPADSNATIAFTIDGRSELDGRPIRQLELAGADVCSLGKPNGVVKRLVAVPAGARRIELTVTEVTGCAILDYWQIEASPPPLVIVATQFRMMNYEPYSGWPADPVSDDDVLRLLNPATRAVAAEFDSAVVVAETDGAFEGDYTVAWDFYPDDAGHARLAEHLYPQLAPHLRSARRGPASASALGGSSEND